MPCKKKTIKCEFKTCLYTIMVKIYITLQKMDGFISLFGKARPESKAAATIPAPTTENAMIDLQSGVDKLNIQIEGWTNQAKDKHKSAKSYMQQNNRVMATQMLAQEKQYLDLINTASVAIAHRSQKMMTITKSQMITDVHTDLESANTLIKGLNNGIDVSKMQDTLIENETMGDEVNELADYMKDSTPYAMSSALDAELDKLSLSDDSEKDIDYDYPAIVRQPATISTTTTTTSTNTIAKSNLFEKLGYM